MASRFPGSGTSTSRGLLGGPLPAPRGLCDHVRMVRGAVRVAAFALAMACWLCTLGCGGADSDTPSPAPVCSLAPGAACETKSQCAPAAEGRAVCLHYGLPGHNIATLCQMLVPGNEGEGPCFATVDGDRESLNGDPVPTGPLLRGFSCDKSAGLWCNPKSRACSSLSDVGPPCSADRDCGQTAWCNAQGACAPRAALGSGCTRNSGCEADGFCSEKKCVPRKPADSLCISSDECQPGDVCLSIGECSPCAGSLRCFHSSSLRPPVTCPP